MNTTSPKKGSAKEPLFRGETKPEQISERDRLIDRILSILNKQVMYTCDESGKCYVTWINDDGFETMTFESNLLQFRIKQIARQQAGKRINRSLVAEIIDEMQGQAHEPGTDRAEVNLRVAQGSNGKIFIDLCNSRNEVIAIDQHGFRLHDFHAEIPLFLRAKGMTQLPNPFRSQGDLDLLRPFVNVHSDAEWRLLIVFLLYSLRPSGPYVVLVISGGAGSSKSTFSRIIRQLIDPSSVSTQGLPRSTADLMVAASNLHLLAFDNVRNITMEMSDAICRIATGGGSRTRTLFTNMEETLIHVTRPCILNGIGDLVDQPDLVSRCIQLNLQPIMARRTEEEFNRSLSANIDAIFAGLLEALSKTLAELPQVQNVPDTRMADFARFGTAVQCALLWEEGSFMEAYALNQREQMTSSLGDQPLANAVRKFVDDLKENVPHTETPTELLRTLEGYASQAELLSKAWPETPHSLSKRLKKIEPALRTCGVAIHFRHSGDRTISLTRLVTFKQ